MGTRRSCVAAVLLMSTGGCAEGGVFAASPADRPAPAVLAAAPPRSATSNIVISNRPLPGRACIDCGGGPLRPIQPPPVIMVDGRVLDLPPGAPLPLEPAQVLDIQYIKPADAVRRYGSFAANGVVEITLKH